MSAGQATARAEAGKLVGVGSYRCRSCGLQLGFEGGERLSRCPGCGGTSFRRGSLFEQQPRSGDDDRGTFEQAALPAAPAAPAWLEEARAALTRPGRYLARRSGSRTQVTELPEGWSRVGRSASSDLRLDDPTVSRRHALIVHTRDGEVRVLDDRSLNGVRVNGRRIEWGSLADGDELTVGRFRLYLLERAPTGSGASASSTDGSDSAARFS